jgi:hypothetical protein
MKPLYCYIEPGLENEVKAGRVPRTCYECGNRPSPPNYLSVYRDEQGMIYSACLKCEDFERDFTDANEEERSKLPYEPYYSAWEERWYAEQEVKEVKNEQ